MINCGKDAINFFGFYVNGFEAYEHWSSIDPIGKYMAEDNW